MTTKPTSFQRVWRLLSYLLRLRVRAWDGNKKKPPNIFRTKTTSKTEKHNKIPEIPEILHRNGWIFALDFLFWDSPTSKHRHLGLGWHWLDFGCLLRDASGVPNHRLRSWHHPTTWTDFWEKRWRSSIFIYPLCWLCSKIVKSKSRQFLDSWFIFFYGFFMIYLWLPFMIFLWFFTPTKKS